MGKVYIVYYDFGGTSGNHAGMSHLVRLLDEHIEFVHPIKSFPHHFKGGKYLAQLYAVWLAVYFRFKLKRGDKVFFFEYLTFGTAFQSLTARLMRLFGIRQEIYALIHLSGQHLLELYKSEQYIRKSLQPVDKIFVFGSTLADFLNRIGYNKDIVVTFHYVDTGYYRPSEKKQALDRLQVICIGSLKRNFRLLQAVVSSVGDVDFHILMGKSNLHALFSDYPNVRLYPFLSEQEMLHLMQSCDVSLSAMEDTVGSNVITTSMAVGLVQVVSDVGSIRDYCDEHNSFFCKGEQDFSQALTLLASDRSLLQQMRFATLQRAEALSFEAFIHQFRQAV